MTNEQLRLLIRSYADRLEIEIDDLRSRLPDDAERMMHTDREYIGPRPDGFSGVIWMNADSNPAHWKETERPGEFVALLGLTQFLDDLRQAEKDLA